MVGKMGGMSEPKSTVRDSWTLGVLVGQVSFALGVLLSSQRNAQKCALASWFSTVKRSVFALDSLCV